MKTAVLIFLTLFIASSACAEPSGHDYAKKMAQDIKKITTRYPVKSRCGYNENSEEVWCAVIPPANSSNRVLHGMQNIAYLLAEDFRGKYPVNYSIYAQTSDDVPLARFLYNYEFDIITPVIMWY